MVKNFIILSSAIRLIPHIVLVKFHNKNIVIEQDIRRWLSIYKKNYNIYIGFIFLMTYFPEFRNLFYKRIESFAILLNWLCPKMDTLFIKTKDIGPGLFIQHGFSTIIAAKSIGENCWINQQVTIGFSNSFDSPILKDNVVINAGAKIIGKLEMGNNSRVGANAVVTKSVPENCTVVGIPAYIIKKQGVKVRESL